jgi:hypothetical protein
VGSGKLKVEHSIIPALRAKLQKLGSSDSIHSIIPGTIKVVKNVGREEGAHFRVTVPINNGWKAIVLSGGARQEVFIKTTKYIDKDAMSAALIDVGLVSLEESESSKKVKKTSRGKKASSLAALLHTILCTLILSMMMCVEAAAMERTWSNRQGLTLTPIAVPSSSLSLSLSPGIWAAERPFVWNNIDVGGRSVVARITEGKHKGGLLIHSPVEWTPALQAELDKLDSDSDGDGGSKGVRVVIAPNYEHLKYFQQWAEQFPDAEMWACPGLPQRIPEVAWGREMKSEVVDDYIECVWFNCEQNPFTGRAFFNEVAFYYRPLKALFFSDAFWNYPEGPLPNFYQINDHDTDALMEVRVPLGTRAWKTGMDRVYLSFYRRFMTLGLREEYAAAREKVLSFDTELIVPCHGDVIRGRGLCERVLRDHFK